MDCLNWDLVCLVNDFARDRTVDEFIEYVEAVMISCENDPDAPITRKALLWALRNTSADYRIAFSLKREDMTVIEWERFFTAIYIYQFQTHDWE